jgi:hypothetical protein
MYPHVILPGAHGLIVQPGKNAINKEYPEMLQRLCRIKAVWCLPSEQTKH